jgi:hypothetical protein
MHMNNRTQEREAVEALIDGSLGSASGAPTNTLLVAGGTVHGENRIRT